MLIYVKKECLDYAIDEPPNEIIEKIKLENTHLKEEDEKQRNRLFKVEDESKALNDLKEKLTKFIQGIEKVDKSNLKLIVASYFQKWLDRDLLKIDNNLKNEENNRKAICEHDLINPTGSLLFCFIPSEMQSKN